MDKAVVLGGSIAGLIAARVLAEHVNTVVIIDRDDLDTTEGSRPGVPQGSQVHALLMGGLRQLERWYPGFASQAQREGAVMVSGKNVLTYVDGVCQDPLDDIEMLCSSRPFLEGLIRRRTLELSNVRTVTGRVMGLDFHSGAVVGVRYQSGDGKVAQAADLVVDAMGRASRLSEWLEGAGWERPPLRRKSLGLNYATGYFTRDSLCSDDVAAVSRRTMTLSTARTAGGTVSPVEGDRWVVLLAGYDHDQPGRSTEDFIRRCREDLPPIFGQAVAGKLIGEIKTYHQADSRRRDFHLVGQLPARLVSVGDAVASFNPVYGQGMTSAALHASCLSAYLRSSPDLDAPAREFFRLQRVVVDAAWQISTQADDARQPDTGMISVAERISRWLGEEVVSAATKDKVMAKRFNDVMAMTAHPSVLFSPGAMLRSIMANRGLIRS
ncbi:FAD-dependent oxidoreductase [[Actinomadura] parvosata]|uniref:FAD-dependent oxidoreductase n=1 Tax=[Actinomadura] parvosata TaxID=1955412 RepID=UPI00406C51E4